MTETKHTESDRERKRRWQVRVSQRVVELEKLIATGAREGWAADPRAAETLLDEFEQALAGPGASRAIAKAIGSPRHWLEECRRLDRARLFLAAPIMPFFCDRARATLSRIDRRAAELTDEQIKHAFRRKQIKTIAGRAARLAADCGAFDFDNYPDAKRHFALLEVSP